MAEAIGLTASIIGIGELATQAAKVVLKLKDFWDQVKEAPDDISFMMLELKVVVSSLETIENQHKGINLPSHIFDMSDMRQSLELCQQAAKQLSDLVTELALQTDTGSRIKRKMGAANFIMKKDHIQKMRTKLSSSISLFKLCRETYTSTILPDMIAHKLYKMSPSSQIIETPPSLQSISCQTIAIESSAPSVSLSSSSSSSLNGCMVKHNQQASETQSSLWVRGSELLGVVEYETNTVALTAAQGGQKERHNSVPYFVTRSVRLSIRPPTWLLRKSWEVLHHNLYGGWTFAFRTYNVVPYNAPVIQYTEAGDLSALQSLFASKQATPFDTESDYPTGLLYVCAEFKNNAPSLMSFMDSVWYPFTKPRGVLLFDGSHQTSYFAPLEYGNISRRLAAYVNKTCEDIELKPNWVSDIVCIFEGDSATFDAFVAQFIPTYWKRSQRTRTISAIDYSSRNGIYSPDMIWKILGLKNEVLDLEIAKTECGEIGTLLHQCSMSMWQIMLVTQWNGNDFLETVSLEYIMPRFPPETIVSFYQDWASGPYKQWTSLRPALLNKTSHAQWNQERQSKEAWLSESCDSWCVLLKHLLDSGASVHTKDRHGRTPLLFGIKAILDYMARYHHLFSPDIEAAANTVLRVWLEALNAVGVNIQKYGAEERVLYSTGKVNKNMPIYKTGFHRGCYFQDVILKWRIINIEYGPSIEDWYIRGSEPTDEYAGQFWTMIDHPEWRLPGAWIEEEESDDDDWYEDTDDEHTSRESESEYDSE